MVELVQTTTSGHWLSDADYSIRHVFLHVGVGTTVAQNLKGPDGGGDESSILQDAQVCTGH